MKFFEQFDSEWGKLLAHRRDGFRATFDYLAKRRDKGHLIVETGCARWVDNWAGDGQSSILFDRFASESGGQVYSVDIDPAACNYARSKVSPTTTVTTQDSVVFLARLGRELVRAGRFIDLLYLDSFDYDWKNPLPSSVHHLKELCAIAPALNAGTLVVLDDSFRSMSAVRQAPNSYALIRDNGISGKALYVAEYFEQIGVPPCFEGYQTGWIMPA